MSVTEATLLPVVTTRWADVANTALHYVAGGFILCVATYLAMNGKVSQDFLGGLLLAAASGVGFKMSR